MFKPHFAYTTGTIVEIGDVVSAAEKSATVEKVVNAGTQDSVDLACRETGGLLLRFDNGDLQLWPYPNEDLTFVSRRKRN